MSDVKTGRIEYAPDYKSEKFVRPMSEEVPKLESSSPYLDGKKALEKLQELPASMTRIGAMRQFGREAGAKLFDDICTLGGYGTIANYNNVNGSQAIDLASLAGAAKHQEDAIVAQQQTLDERYLKACMQTLENLMDVERDERKRAFIRGKWLKYKRLLLSIDVRQFDVEDAIEKKKKEIDACARRHAMCEERYAVATKG